MPSLVGINHIALEVDDIDEALAFIDMGDQFIALARGRTQPPDQHRHFGLVVDDKEEVGARLRELGIPVSSGRGLDFRDPSGNLIQIVDYREVQFTKTDNVLSAMGLNDLEKSESAQAELRAKGISV